MNYQGYKELDIYKSASKLAVEIHKMTINELPAFEKYEEGNQIRRSSKSIVTNIVEGFGRRRYKNEFIQFLTYALASCDETREHLNILFETGSLKNRDFFEYSVSEYDKLGKQLTRFIQSVERNHLTPKPASSIRYPASRKGFTLLEVMVAIAVFALVVASTGSVFVSVQRAWRKQRAAINLIQNGRWAMEFMSNQIRHTTVTGNPGWARAQITGGGNRLSIGLDTNADEAADTRVWFWRGNTASDATGLGDSTYIYRGVGANIGAAYGARQQLANFIVNNGDLVNNTTGLPPADGSTDPIFILNNGLITVELTFRPNPTVAAGTENRNYALITQSRPRN